MSFHKAVSLGLLGNEMSREIAGTREVSAGRTVVATGVGAALGTAASGALVVAGVAAAPVMVPLAVATGVVSFVASLFD